MSTDLYVPKFCSQLYPLLIASHYAKADLTLHPLTQKDYKNKELQALSPFVQKNGLVFKQGETVLTKQLAILKHLGRQAKLSEGDALF